MVAGDRPPRHLIWDHVGLLATFVHGHAPPWTEAAAKELAGAAQFQQKKATQTRQTEGLVDS